MSRLHQAATQGDLKVVKELLAAKENPDSLDENGWTPLHLAAQAGHFHVVEALLAANTDPSRQLAIKFSPLHIAAQNGNVDVINALLAKNAIVNSIGPSGITPLMMAIEHGRVGAVKALLSASADPGIAAVDGSTALSLSAATNRLAIIKILLDLNVDASLAVRYQDKGKIVHETPVQVAQRKGFREAAALIQAHLDKKPQAAQPVSLKAHVAHAFLANRAAPAAHAVHSRAAKKVTGDEKKSQKNELQSNSSPKIR